MKTSEGVKVADVAWLSDTFVAQHGFVTPYLTAPELCVEIVSPSHSDEEMRWKADLYLARGAQEVWGVREDGRIQVFGHPGEVAASRLFPGLGIDLPPG